LKFSIFLTLWGFALRRPRLWVRVSNVKVTLAAVRGPTIYHPPNHKPQPTTEQSTEPIKERTNTNSKQQNPTIIMSSPKFLSDDSAIPIEKVDHEQSQVVYPDIYKSHLKSLLIPYSEISKRASELALEIHKAFPCDKPIVLLCILKGSSPFCHFLMKHLSLLRHPFIIEFLKAKSYVGTSSSGTVQVSSEKLPYTISGRNVLVVEDIVDTGNTLNVLLPILQSAKPKSVQVCTMLVKRISGSTTAQLDSIIPKLFAGFSIPDAFVIGFGLDYNQLYRDLLDVWIISQEGIAYGADSK
jgi:hypoxanthine phosphoribosyltransferase